MWYIPVAAGIAFSLDRLLKQQEQNSGPRPPGGGEGFGLLIGFLGMVGAWVVAYVLGPRGYGLLPLTAVVLLFYPGGLVPLCAGFYAGRWIYRLAVKPPPGHRSNGRGAEGTQGNSPTPTWYWWWPFSWQWPIAFPQDETVAAFVKVYGMHGYSPCVDGSLEPGYEKIALYAIGPAVKNVARQLPGGKWTSKLGMYFDIEHTLDEGPRQGTPVQFLRRARAGA
jgi:hypothetical protein